MAKKLNAKFEVEKFTRKKNLISLGVLDSDGYKFTGQDGVLKVFKEALVVMKAKKVGNIYRLKGSTKVMALSSSCILISISVN